MECNGTRPETEQSTALLLQSVFGDLVARAVPEPTSKIPPQVPPKPLFKTPHKTIPKTGRPINQCSRLFQALGFATYSCSEEDSEEEKEVIRPDVRDMNAPNHRSQWNSWIVEALADDDSDGELELYRRTFGSKQLQSCGVQTEQPRFGRKMNGVVTPGDRLLRSIPTPIHPAPCELTHQTIFFEALSHPAPTLLNRPPMADRFCYMLTDFASALYCSLAIMCCCTPNMFR